MVVLLQHRANAHAEEDRSIGREADSVEEGIGDERRAWRERPASEQLDYWPSEIVLEDGILEAGFEESSCDEGACSCGAAVLVSAIHVVELARRFVVRHFGCIYEDGLECLTDDVLLSQDARDWRQSNHDMMMLSGLVRTLPKVHP